MRQMPRDIFYTNRPKFDLCNKAAYLYKGFFKEVKQEKLKKS